MKYFVHDYIEAAEDYKQMPLTYAIVHFDCDDGNMLYGISKTVKFCDGCYLGSKRWVFINNEELNNETFENKIREYAQKFENKGYKVNITMVLS